MLAATVLRLVWVSLLVKIKAKPHRAATALTGGKGLCNQCVQLLLLLLELTGITLPMAPSIITATRYSKGRTLDANAAFACIVMHERVLHFRPFAKYAAAFFNMASSSACLAT